MLSENLQVEIIGGLFAILAAVLGAVVSKLLDLRKDSENKPQTGKARNYTIMIVIIVFLLVLVGASWLLLRPSPDQQQLVQSVASLDFEDLWIMEQDDVNNQPIQTVYPVVAPDPTNSEQYSLKADISLDLSDSTKPVFWLSWIKAEPFRASSVSGRVRFASAALSLEGLYVCAVPDQNLEWGCAEISFDKETDDPIWISFDADLTNLKGYADYSDFDLAKIVIYGNVGSIPGADGSDVTVFVDDFNVT